MARARVWTLPASLPAWELTVVRPEQRPAEQVDRTVDDGELVAACLEGRPGAFDILVERHRRSVYLLCYRFAGNHEDASDLSQEVFLRAFRGLKSFRGQSALGTWLHRIGVNVCLNRAATKAVRQEPIDERQMADTRHESAAESLIRDERAVRVRQAVAALPPKQRAALILRIYHDMPHQEIARTLRSSVGAVKANVFHALQNLKRALSDECT
jgi:RNA polymerase sigma-70 factor (ECF subfamily)